nr:hypothetical protein [Sicyoidochytrium minutum DNA virus]
MSEKMRYARCDFLSQHS